MFGLHSGVLILEEFSRPGNQSGSDKMYFYLKKGREKCVGVPIHIICKKKQQNDHSDTRLKTQNQSDNEIKEHY